MGVCVCTRALGGGGMQLANVDYTFRNRHTSRSVHSKMQEKEEQSNF